MATITFNLVAESVNNNTFKYYPDFILDDNIYIEIKGYLDDKSKEKIKQFKYKLKILYKTDLKHMFKYVKSKYGDDFISLYDKKL